VEDISSEPVAVISLKEMITCKTSILSQNLIRGIFERHVACPERVKGDEELLKKWMKI